MKDSTKAGARGGILGMGWVRWAVVPRATTNAESERAASSDSTSLAGS
jgi:hypothetical protein